MAIIVKPNTFSAGAVIIAAEHNSNFDTMYDEFNGNIHNANINASAAIADTKLAQLTTAQKVNTSALVTTSGAIGDILYADTATSYTRRATGGATSFLAGGTTPSYRNINLTSDATGKLPVANGGTGESLILPTANGGTGKDFSGSAQGGIPYISATGVVSILTAGTSGKLLETNGAGANPAWVRGFSMSFEESATFSASTSVSVTETISSGDVYMVIFEGTVDSTTVDDVFFRINSDATSLYQYFFAGNQVISSSTVAAISGASAVGTPAAQFDLINEFDYNSSGSFFIKLFITARNSMTQITWEASNVSQTGEERRLVTGTGFYTGGTPTSFQFLPSSACTGRYYVSKMKIS